jgi:hypothetical protein
MLKIIILLLAVSSPAAAGCVCTCWNGSSMKQCGPEIQGNVLYCGQSCPKSGEVTKTVEPRWHDDNAWARPNPWGPTPPGAEDCRQVYMEGEDGYYVWRTVCD